MSYFWHVLIEGGNCLNFINTNQNSFPNLLAHTGETRHGSCYRPKLLNEPKRATAPCDDWWTVGLIWCSHIVDCWSCIHGAEGERLETICERLVVIKKKKSKEVSRGGTGLEVKERSVWKKKKKRWIFLEMFTIHQFKYKILLQVGMKPKAPLINCSKTPF